jgi:hypothetical protein
MEMIGFKEWTLICEALGHGEQSIILRKGGIAEGREGFRFKHPAFFLFPTLFHEQVSKLRLPPETPLPLGLPEDSIVIRYWAEVQWTADLHTWESVERLEPFHLWRNEVLRERFAYDPKDGKQGISLAFLRVHRLETPWEIPQHPRYGGCRSWVDLPQFEGTVRDPVLPHASNEELDQKIRATIQG